MKTTHELDFYASPYHFNSVAFKIGTCNGCYESTDKYYGIIAIFNEHSGNGHLEDVFEWFEHSCKRDKKELWILEVWNKRFKNHLITKRGFIPIKGTNHVRKKII